MPASRASQPPLPWMPEAMERLPLATLVPFARNSRTHSEAQVAQIVASIREFGWTNPVLIDAAGTIIAGHGRVLAARLLGLDAVPCVRLSHLSESQRRAYVIADNKLALNAGWDDEALAIELQALNEDWFNLGVIGFAPEELTAIGIGVQDAAMPDLGAGDRGADDIGTITIRLPLSERDEVMAWLDTFESNNPSAAILKACRNGNR